MAWWAALVAGIADGTMGAPEHSTTVKFFKVEVPDDELTLWTHQPSSKPRPHANRHRPRRHQDRRHRARRRRRERRAQRVATPARLRRRRSTRSRARRATLETQRGATRSGRRRHSRRDRRRDRPRQERQLDVAERPAASRDDLERALGRAGAASPTTPTASRSPRPPTARRRRRRRLRRHPRHRRRRRRRGRGAVARRAATRIAGEWGHNRCPGHVPTSARARRATAASAAASRRFSPAPASRATIGDAAGAIDTRRRRSSPRPRRRRRGRRAWRATTTGSRARWRRSSTCSTRTSSCSAAACRTCRGSPRRRGAACRATCSLIASPRASSAKRHGDSSGVRGAAWLWPQEAPDVGAARVPAVEKSFSRRLISAKWLFVPGSERASSRTPPSPDRGCVCRGPGAWRRTPRPLTDRGATPPPCSLEKLRESSDVPAGFREDAGAHFLSACSSSSRE